MKTFRAALLPIIFLYLPLAQAKVAAHEWGTFTSLLGSNGVTQDGMYHEDEELPQFVHGFGELAGPRFEFPEFEFCGKIPCEFLRRNSVTQKMETPVIYFYAGGEIDVTVDVKFPEGVVSETFPGPTFTFPARNSPPLLANGHTIFNVKAHTMGDTSLLTKLPAVPAGNIYGHARNVPDASVVSINNEYEKFIFYRGVGRFTPKTSITSNNGNLALHHCAGCGNIPAAFLVGVDRNGHARMIPLGPLAEGQSKVVSAGDIAALRQHGVNDRPSSALRGDLIGALTYAGLFEPEAIAMIDTWENGYLKVPGLRLLYILPEQEVDTVLPVTLTPDMPFERVFVGRLEIMLDTDELDLLGKILAARDLIDVKQLGRFSEPMLRRIREVLVLRSPAQADLELMDRLIERAKRT